METDKKEIRNLVKMAGVSGILTTLFIPAIILQTGITPWFPEEALQSGTMNDWIVAVSLQKAEALLGVGLFIIMLLQLPVVGSVLYRLVQNTPSADWAFMGVVFQTVGVALALAAFCFGYGFTWALANLYQQSSEVNSLSPLATVGMRGFLVGDDMATALIAASNVLLSRAAIQVNLLPKWLYYWALIAVILVVVVLLRYFVPAFSFAAIGYPMVLTWYIFVGAILIRKKDFR